MRDRIPLTTEGQLLSIADKAVSIAGMFGLGLEPTGSKDPFALRRAANGIIQILAQSEVQISLSEVVSACAIKEEQIRSSVFKFLRERLESYLGEVENQPYDVIAAVLNSRSPLNDFVKNAILRSKAVSSLRHEVNFRAICAAFKRMKNILMQANDQNVSFPAEPNLLIDVAEITLSQELRLKAAQIQNLASGDDYQGAIQEIAEFGPLLENFFRDVMVMTDDEELRASRLSLVSRVLTEFAAIADFSEIVISG